MSAAPIRFQRLVIEELFGPGSPTIDIPFQTEKRVTVLYGRNGSGKTIVLELIAALRGGRYEELLRYPFRRVTIERSDGASVELEYPSNVDPKKGASPLLRYTLNRPGSEPEIGVIQRGVPAVAGTFGVIERRGSGVAGGWGASTGGVLLTPSPERTGTKVLESSALRAFREQLSPVKLIETDRLFVRDDGADRQSNWMELPSQAHKARLMVDRLSEAIKEPVQRADREYRRLSSELDSSLPQRLFKPIPNLPSLEALKEREQALRNQEARLQALGLLGTSAGAIGDDTLNPAQLSAYFVILQDREQKLAPFAEIVNKAERLLDSLNRKLAPKVIRLNVDTGYAVFTAANTPLPLDRLSSGEQHELVLLHELLFDVQPGSLILIDEPELSLNPSWQRDMLPDLMEIARLSSLDFVLATHSPYIVGENEDLMVLLGAPP